MAVASDKTTASISLTYPDGTTKTAPSGMAAGDEPFGLALASLGGTTYLYVTNLVTHNVTIINTSTLAIVGNIP